MLPVVLCDFIRPFAMNGSIRLPEVQRKALFFDQSKIPAERKLNYPFAESSNWGRRDVAAIIKKVRKELSQTKK